MMFTRLDDEFSSFLNDLDEESTRDRHCCTVAASQQVYT